VSDKDNGVHGPNDVLMQEVPGRYLVGIDLGTTNCAVAYVDTQSNSPSVINFKVPQWVDWQTSEERETLPSFSYQWTAEEQSQAASLADEIASREKVKERSSKNSTYRSVGVWARERGSQTPGRQIASAKSWLCHEGVDRTSPLLPWHADNDVEKISPVVASSFYLAKIVEAWNHKFPSHPLAEQEVILTLPASFDEIARELTLEAARLAGLTRVFLIEEPQAAFYAWLHRHSDSWDKIIQPGQSILVCDIGGGTTDFTLIRVREAAVQAESEILDRSIQSQLTLHRVAVGQHLILGGDNFDLALAKFVEDKLSGGKQLPHRQWEILRQRCRSAKEILLGNGAPGSYTIHLPSGGSRLLSEGLQAVVTREDINKVLVDGFFPEVALSDKPTTVVSGFVEFGLPYASDAAITKHLASFLTDHAWAGRSEKEKSELSELRAARPDWILFNGGVLESGQIQDRVVSIVSKWFAEKDDSAKDRWKPGVLEAPRKDLAVAEGAAYFGLVRRGKGIKIDARLARSYYLTVSKNPPRSICLVPGEAAAGDRFVLDSHPFELAVGVPVEFNLYVSSLRLADPVGSVVEIDPTQMHPLPPIRTVIEAVRSKQKTTERVKLEAELSEIGTLQLSCVSISSGRRWKMDFDIRSALESGRSGHSGMGEAAGIVEQDLLLKSEGVLRAVFVDGSLPPARLMKELKAALEIDRNQWPPSLLRGMWQQLIDCEEGRRRSPEHELRWLNLVGYCLRPGYGMAADDWRVTESWRRVHGKLAFPAISSRQEAIVLWRRVAGGFTAGQQLALFQSLQSYFRDQIANRGKAIRTGCSELVELIRLIGSLELLPIIDKTKLVDVLAEVARDKKATPLHSGAWWAIGRLASRSPLYGPLTGIVNASKVEQWIDQWLILGSSTPEMQLAMMQVARRTGDRYRDLSEESRNDVLQWFERTGAPEHYQQLVREVGVLADNEKLEVMGDSLPLGLRIPGLSD
jgi:hypothetical protein